MPIHNTAEGASAVSRSSVYVSLKSLDASDEKQLSASSMTKIPRNVQDESLISFYETVSKDYHRSVPRLDGKNTSGRPLSASEISGRIRQRALTVVGGGYNAKPVVTANRTMKTKTALSTNNFLLRGQNPSSNLSGRHRKRKRINLWHRLNSTNSCADKSTEDQIVITDGLFLMRLNDEWNTYIRNVLTLDSILDGAAIDRSLLQKQITTLVAQDLIEWVGSLVQIKNCAKIPKMKGLLVGMKGILISHSASSWEIIPFRCQLKNSKRKVDSSSKSNTDSHVAEGSILDTGSHDFHHEAAAISIPKFGSTIAVEIPLMTSFAISNVARDEAQSISILLQGG